MVDVSSDAPGVLTKAIAMTGVHDNIWVLTVIFSMPWAEAQERNLDGYSHCMDATPVADATRR